MPIILFTWHRPPFSRTTATVESGENRCSAEPRPRLVPGRTHITPGYLYALHSRSLFKIGTVAGYATRKHDTCTRYNIIIIRSASACHGHIEIVQIPSSAASVPESYTRMFTLVRSAEYCSTHVATVCCLKAQESGYTTYVTRKPIFISTA